MLKPAGNAHQLFLSWLILIGVSLFGFFVAFDQGLLAQLYDVDKSRICWGITLLFAVTCGHAAWRIWLLSGEENRAGAVGRALENAPPGSVTVQDGRLCVAGQGFLPESLLTRYLCDLAARSLQLREPLPEAAAANAELVEVYRHRLSGSHEFGWYSADLMLKLGLLGTIVGFVMMLGSVLNVEDFTADTMQGVLRNMSTGMGTALYTTFAGLVCSMLTTAQYYLLERASGGLVETARQLAQTRVLPNLAPVTAGA